MPTNNPSDRLEWSEENLERTISDLYREIETDEDLRQRLLDTPFEVLSSRIAIPESYRDGILLARKGQNTIVLYVPTTSPGRVETEAVGTTDEVSQQNYEMLCSIDPPW